MSPHEVIVEADGGSRGNPGVAGYGAVVYTADHAQVLAERKGYLGVTTNNVAEYHGLIAGLTAAAELGAQVVAVRLDSKLVVEQMSGRWKVKHAAMKPLAEQARTLVASFEQVSFQWIPRHRNTHADRLANAAMDAASEGVDTGSDSAPPPAPAASEPAPASTAQQFAPGWTGASGRPTRLLLLRHGQTELSVQRRYSGRGNPPLTALGARQARLAAARLAERGAIAAVVSSPLERATATAQAVSAALDVPQHTHVGLTETDFGEWEGLTFAEAAARDPQRHADWLRDPSLAPPGGESFEQVATRVHTVRTELADRYPGENIVVVSHVTPIKLLLQQALTVGPGLLYRLHLDLASLSIAEFYPDGGSAVRLVNDTSHLVTGAAPR